MTIDAMRFRETLARVPTSVAVVTTVGEGGRPYGVTVGSLCLLSFDPPLLLFCLDQRSRSHAVFSAADHFVVNVLREDQDSVARRFATSRVDRFTGLPVHSNGVHGLLPTIPGALATATCARHHVERAGDHSIVIGLVQETELGAGRPLLYFEHRYWSLTADLLSCPEAVGAPVASGHRL